MSPPPEVAVAVVSWNTRELLLRCLDSLAPEVGDRTAVWVVDNASTDGSAAAARHHAPWAEVVEPGLNLGFGPAINLVAARTQSRWLLVCNADVALEPGALPALLEAGQGPEVGCVAPRLLLPDGRTQHSVHAFPDLGFTLAWNLGLLGLSGRLSERLCLNGSWDPDLPREVPWALGACLLIRREAFAAIGGFDPRQWMYAEDLDLGWRLRQGGWVVRYAPAARVQHESGAAAAQAFGPDPTDRFMASTYALLRRRRGTSVMLAIAAANLAGAAGRLAWMGPAARLAPRFRARAADQRRWLRAHLAGLRAARRAAAEDPAADARQPGPHGYHGADDPGG